MIDNSGSKALAASPILLNNYPSIPLSNVSGKIAGIYVSRMVPTFDYPAREAFNMLV